MFTLTTSATTTTTSQTTSLIQVHYTPVCSAPSLSTTTTTTTRLHSVSTSTTCSLLSHQHHHHYTLPSSHDCIPFHSSLSPSLVPPLLSHIFTSKALALALSLSALQCNSPNFLSISTTFLSQVNLPSPLSICVKGSRDFHTPKRTRRCYIKIVWCE